MGKRSRGGVLILTVFFISICLIFSATIPAVSQESAISLQGKVTDENKKPIEGAVISLVNLRTGRTYRANTDKKGRYRLIYLDRGFYNISCSKQGYITKIRENYTMVAQDGAKSTDYMQSEQYDSMTKRWYSLNFTLKKMEGTDPAQLFQEAVKDFQNRNIDSAIEKLNKYKELVPDNQNAYILLGRGYYVKKLWKESKEAYEKFFSFNPENVSFQDYFITGELCLRLGEAEKADEYFNKTEAAKPNDPQILYFIGTTYYNSGIYDKAAERFKKAVELKPDYADALRELASSYFQLEDWDNTAIYFEKYLDFDPNSSLALLALGDAYSNRFAKSKDKGEAERAIEYYQKYIELNPDASNTEKIKEKINELKSGISGE